MRSITYFIATTWYSSLLIKLNINKEKCTGNLMTIALVFVVNLTSVYLISGLRIPSGVPMIIDKNR